MNHLKQQSCQTTLQQQETAQQPSLQSNQLFSSTIRAVFEQAYALGRTDTLEGYHIAPALAYEHFWQQQEQLKQRASASIGI